MMPVAGADSSREFHPSYKSTAKACNLSPQQARDDFFHLEPTSARTRWALSLREFGILPSQRDVHHHVQPSWITVFSWSGRMSPPIEATRALLVLIHAQLNLADASVWVVAGHPARVFG